MQIYRYQDSSTTIGIGIGVGPSSFVPLRAILEARRLPIPLEVQQANLHALIADEALFSAFVVDPYRVATTSGLLEKLPHQNIDDVKLLAPIPRPGKFICVGLNYKDHCEEQNVPPPSNPVIFAKFANAVCGPKDIVRRPACTSKLDFEGELGVVIGKRGKRIQRDEALSYVFGYMIINDVSARDIQKNDGQWLRAKSMDGFAPTGPCITTADEIPDPQNLSLRTTVNGQVMQESHTSRMIFPVAELIEFISQAITLEPGDIISTGTPSGVGVWRTPPVFLKAGDVVRIEIEKLGVLENEIADDNN